MTRGEVSRLARLERTLVGAAGREAQRRRIRRRRAIVLCVVAAPLALAAIACVLFAFSKKAFCNYYFFVLGAFCIAIVADGRGYAGRGPCRPAG